MGKSALSERPWTAPRLVDRRRSCSDVRRALRFDSRRQHAGAKVEDELLSGSAAIVLCDFAARSQARLVVVSSLGQIAPSRWFIGSVAERLAQISTVPTLVVRGDGAFKEWAQRERALNILFGPAPMRPLFGRLDCERLGLVRSLSLLWRGPHKRLGDTASARIRRC